MVRTSGSGIVASWLALVVGWGMPALAFEGPRALDLLSDAERNVQIEWKENWDATYKANVGRWEGEVKRLNVEQRERELVFRMRVVKLLEALIARYPNETDKRFEAYREIAGNYYSLYLRDHGNYVLKKVIEESPGRLDFAAPALAHILEQAPWGSPWETQEGPAWSEYAATRLVALHRAGNLPEGHTYVVTALRALALLRRAQGRFIEAEQGLEALEAHSGRDDWWLLERAELLFATGREQEALPLFQDLFGRSEENSRARDRIAEILADAFANPPSFSSQFGLETKWEGARSSPPADVVDRIGELFKDDAEGKNLLPWRDARHASVWTLLDRHLLSLDAAALKLVREAQERVAGPLLNAATGGPLDKLVAVYRCCPLAAASHRALLRCGEDALRRGQAGLALRSFHDVLSHAADAGLRSQAQVGVRLALAQDVGGTGVPPVDKPPQPTPLAAIQRCVLQMPPAGLWQPELFGRAMPRELAVGIWPLPVRPQAFEGGVLAAGPELLACFGGDPRRPLWTRSPCRSVGKWDKLTLPDEGLIVLPGPFQPAIDGDRVYSRWGLDPTRRFLTGLAAFDLHGGEVLWSTATDPAWDDQWPIGDPTVAEGRLYVLTLQKGYSSVLPVSTVSLACLDAAAGQLLWRRPMASQNLTMLPSSRSPLNGRQLDFVHYGNAVTVHDGAVYCQTNMGFVARCDARDGVVEWTYTYPRVQLRWNVHEVARRQGAAPLVAAGHVAFLPRDTQGVFALDASTGKLAWDEPFAPSAEAVGQADGLLLVNDTRGVAAVKAASGRVRWHRFFPEGLAGRPALAGPGLCVGTPSKLCRIEAATGRLLEEAEWGATGPMAAFGLRSGSLLAGLTDDAVGSDKEPVKQPLNPKAVAARGPLRLPLATSWRLERPNPTLWVPPPEAKADGKLYLVSRGVLECVLATAQGGIEWQRGLAPGCQEAVWTDNTLLLLYPRSVTCIEAATGKLRWEAEAPFTIREWQLAGPYLVLGDYGGPERSRRTCVLDLASGRRLWYREFNELGGTWDNYLVGIGWDGKLVHLYGGLSREGQGQFDVACDPKDGTIRSVQRFMPKGREWPILLDVGEAFGFYVDQDRVAYGFEVGSAQPPTRYNANLRDLVAESEKRLRRARGHRTLQQRVQWVQVDQQEGYPSFRHAAWTLQRGDPSYELRRPRAGTIRGDRLFEIDHQSVRVVDLPSRKEVAQHGIELPAGQWAKVLDFDEQGDQMLVVSGLRRGPYESIATPYRVQLDVFDKATGTPRGRQVLDAVPYWRFAVHEGWYQHKEHETQVAWADGLLFLTDADGLVALASAGGTGVPPVEDDEVHVAFTSPGAVVLDGSLDDWDTRGAIPVEGQGGRRGQLLLSHDGDDLHLALRFPSSSARTRRGRGDYGGGDWLELGLTTHEGSWHWGIGADDHHGVASDALGASGVPPDARAAVAYDPLTMQFTCEITVPMKGILKKGSHEHWRRLGLSLAAWRDLPNADEAGRGRPRVPARPVRLVAWGGGLTGQRLTPEHHRAVFLNPLSLEGEEAGLAIADQLPELPESFDFFEWTADIRARTSSTRVLTERYGDYLRRHPSGVAAVRALVVLDQKLRTRLDTDPSAGILKLAQEAGVSDAVRAHYAHLTKPYLSQWVNIDPKKRPGTLMLELYDGIAEGTWNHRVAWGNDVWYDWGQRGTPSRRHDGLIPAAEGWQELRIPLIWLDLQDTPVNGISFMEHGGGSVVWDRSAIVYPGGERVFLDDEPPKGAHVEGPWKWIADPRKSGARAHTDPNPGDENTSWRRIVWGFPTPIYEHIRPPEIGPVLSQWVYLDPAKPPRTIALHLMSWGNSEFRALWGEPLREGRYMGPLPPLGAWHELRIPLACTGILCKPIHGIDFEQCGGSVTWDRTAIVNDGRETIVIEDQMPEANARGEAWTWVDKPIRSGKKAHTQAAGADYTMHGFIYMKDWITQHMPFDYARLEAVVRANLPKLGPTAQAWSFFDALGRTQNHGYRERIELGTWFLKALPLHPNALQVLKVIRDAYAGLNEPDVDRAMDKVLDDCKLPRATRYAFHRQLGAGENSFIRTWRVLGPFPNPKGEGHAKPYPPETEPVRLDRAYDVPGGQARWKFHAAGDSAIDLAKLFTPNEHVVAYAICWVYSDRGRFVSFEVGSDDGVKLWVNRKLELDHQVERAIEQGRDTVPAYLRRGWNEVLVKVENGIKLWAFCVELLDREGRGLLKDVTVSTTPPPADSAPKP